MNYNLRARMLMQSKVSPHVETCCSLSRMSNRKPDTKVEIEIDMEEYYRIKDSNKQN